MDRTWASLQPWRHEQGIVGPQETGRCQDKRTPNQARNVARRTSLQGRHLANLSVPNRKRPAKPFSRDHVQPDSGAKAGPFRGCQSIANDISIEEATRAIPWPQATA